jgi:hypothetical protein
LEIVLILMQDRCMIYDKSTMSMPLGTSNGAPR